MGIMLVRSGSSVPIDKNDREQDNPRRIISYVGYGIMVLGVIVFVVALRMK